MTSFRRFRKECAPLAVLALFIAALHYKVLFLGEQPVGGDKTAFFYGLMAQYGDSLKQGSIPFWNERWGFGFPGVAESQIGAFYPPHALLFGLLDPIDAYRCNYLLHHFAAAILAYVAFRCFHLRRAGALLAALSIVGGGFATVHFDHQWAIESMTWMAPILAAAHRWRIKGSRAAILMSPWLIAMQLSIGHFQVAFMTLAMSAMIVALPNLAGPKPSIRLSALAGRTLRWLLAVAAGFAIAGPQVATTFEFQRHVRAANPNVLNRDYLANFALPPDRLVGLLWPMLYFREPLWREVVWDPWKTSPEECLNYAGLLPLAFAAMSSRFCRRRYSVAAAMTVFIASTILALGPFTPLFDLTSRMPGFGYFRSPARWTLGQEFAIAWLAGWMCDRIRLCRLSSRRALLLFGAAWLAVGFGLGFSWRLLIVNRVHPPDWAGSITAFWTPRDWPNPFVALTASIGQPRNWSGMTAGQWMNLGRPDRPFTMSETFNEMLRLEFVPTLIAGLIVGCAATAAAWRFSDKPRRAVTLLIAGCIADLLIFGFAFLDRSAVRTGLIPEGETMTMVRTHAAGQRVLAPGGNFFQAVGAAPVGAYRTLDVPWNPAFFGFVDSLLAGNADSIVRLGDPPWSLMGIRCVVEQFAPASRKAGKDATQIPDDRQLDLWIYGNDLVRKYLAQRTLRNRRTITNPGESELTLAAENAKSAALANEVRFLLATPSPAIVADRSYVVERGDAIWSSPVIPSAAPPVVVSTFGGLYASPPKLAGVSKLIRKSPTSRVFQVDASAPAVMVIGELFLPGWKAELRTGDGPWRSAPIGPCDAYWQAVSIPSPGTFEVRLSYIPPGFGFGLQSAYAAIALWCALAIWLVRRSSSKPWKSLGSTAANH